MDSTLRTPVFHDPAGVREVGGKEYRVTRCDLAVPYFDATLRRDHAELFCRPCKRCWYGL